LPVVLEHRLIRFDRLAVMVPTDHQLAASPQVPLAALAGETLYAAAGNEDTTEWTDYARSLCAGRGIELAPPYPKIEGEVEFSRVMSRHRWLVLASLSFMTVPEMVLRPLTDPVPLTPVSMVWRRSLHHPGGGSPGQRGAEPLHRRGLAETPTRILAARSRPACHRPV
jgi:DNA-binding transcriptional LysR family regulator